MGREAELGETAWRVGAIPRRAPRGARRRGRSPRRAPPRRSGRDRPRPTRSAPSRRPRDGAAGPTPSARTGPPGARRAGVRARTSVPSGSPDDDVVVPEHAVLGAEQPASTGPGRPHRSSRPPSRPSCWPSGFGRDSPPSAAATSWWPRQIPSVGVRRSTASRTSVLTAPSQGACRRRARPSTHRGRGTRRGGEVVGQLVSRVGVAYVEPAAGLGEPVPDPRRRAVVLVLDDEDVRSGHSAGTCSRSASQAAALRVARHPPVAAGRHGAAGTDLGTVGQRRALELAGEEPGEEHLEPVPDLRQVVLRSALGGIVRRPLPPGRVGPGVLRQEGDLARPRAVAHAGGRA